jgi:hypothetical protein
MSPLPCQGPPGPPLLLHDPLSPHSFLPVGYSRPTPGLRASTATQRARTPPLIYAPAPLPSQQEAAGRTWLKVVLENFAPEEAAESHGAAGTAARWLPEPAPGRRLKTQTCVRLLPRTNHSPISSKPRPCRGPITQGHQDSCHAPSRGPISSKHKAPASASSRRPVEC